jgi:peroxiredoxin
MMKLRSATTSITLVILLSLLQACGGKQEIPKPVIGQPAPNFDYEDMTGSSGSMRGLKGKVTLLRFWADWCPYCKFEMPRIDVFYRRLRKKGFEVVAVNVAQTSNVVEAFTAQLNLSYPMILDPDGKLAQFYGVKGIPTNFLIDRSGILREILVGEIFIEDRVLEDLLRPYFPEEGL